MPRKQKEFHFIYKTTCEVTKRYYYGMHSTDNLDDGYIGSGKRLWHSINYHGIKNHSIEILEYFDNRESLKNREKELITEEMLKDPMCMNLQLGGNSGWSKTAQEQNTKIRLEKLKDPQFKKEFGNRVSNGIKNSSKRENMFNWPNWNGRSHSDESKKKMSESSNNKGSNNSQFGTCWIHNDIENKKIKKDNLMYYLKLGWVNGRKIKR